LWIDYQNQNLSATATEGFHSGRRNVDIDHTTLEGDMGYFHCENCSDNNYKSDSDANSQPSLYSLPS